MQYLPNRRAEPLPLTAHRPARPIPAKPSRSVAHEHCRCLVCRRQSRSVSTRAGPGSRPHGGGRRDRADAGNPRTSSEPAARGAAVPHAAAALGGRRPGRALDLPAHDRGDRPLRRLGRLEHLRRQQRGADRALHPARGGAHDLRRSARPDLLGTAQPAPRHRRARAATGSPANGISPRARGRPTGSARTAMSSSRTARCGSTASAGRPCAPC